ncbi:MAG: glycerol-3-phosphate 1-O-acyltransferase PlsY [Terrimicrobiaceae bacterium]|nr:glycerol-3-phosphate 1-O-acyltransferase PlsY [Terrimicrobiaceae bacterium]
MLVYLLVVLVAYLLGSIPTGYLVGRFRGVDLRKEGSGNIGATNAVRVLGKKLGYFVFAVDILKGLGAVALGAYLAGFAGHGEAGSIAGRILGAVFVVVGHNFPVWLGFKGGKGIATSGGAAIALFPLWVFFGCLIVWVLLFFTTRYVSIASIGAALGFAVIPVILAFTGGLDWFRAGIGIVMCVLAIWRHKSNIQRLLAGTEKRFGSRAAT